MKLRLSIFGLLLMLPLAMQASCSRKVPAQPSCTFVQSPELQRVSWHTNLPVKLFINESVPVEAYPIIDEAIKQYNDTVGGGREIYRIVARGVSGDSSMTPHKDGYSTIYWVKNWDPSRPTEQARTTIYWSGNEIFEADIRINADNFKYYFGDSDTFDDLDFMSLLTHELGHGLGLAHNPTHGSVMNISLDEGQVRRKLGDVDVSNLHCEY